MATAGERQKHLSSLELKKLVVERLARRGVSLEDMAALVYFVQKKYIDRLTMEDCRSSVEHVLEKREVQNAILTGLSLDEMAERGFLEEPLSSMVRSDDGLYGIDEVLALSIVNVYGSIGLTNFGYLDKMKPGIIGQVNDRKGKKVNTFLDDLLAAVVAAAAARLAHRDRDGCLLLDDGAAACSLD
ncbi:phosphatidylglycerophosphatase A [Desulfofundulus thermobenzoicus]|uniref:Phosphatidylglycerophosphatase A n=1 Tax=Desulfofundulus thermobenzoicus TaxID=29376 RepID=A0A6N7ISZ2_9FIRM|nr:phosphatidylglycerophosphatase A [Desulfofundulus thermobenzoicus]MQL53236.1 phosphatidylglycerophosphatase A [Desulfofundulus thermobenzoicus]HHW44178.1 phosphatidylglycerophosphatase A [Desulfotomaculum sp.]